MLQRNLVYTGITRGMQLVVLVGQKKALAMAVKNHLGRRRYTKLGGVAGTIRSPVCRDSSDRHGSARAAIAASVCRKSGCRCWLI